MKYFFVKRAGWSEKESFCQKDVMALHRGNITNAMKDKKRPLNIFAKTSLLIAHLYYCLKVSFCVYFYQKGAPRANETSYIWLYSFCFVEKT